MIHNSSCIILCYVYLNAWVRPTFFSILLNRMETEGYSLIIIVDRFLVFEVLVREKDFSYFLSNEIYFGCIFTVGSRNQSLKILFIDNVNILEYENNVPLKSRSDIVKEKENVSDLVTKQKGQTAEVIQGQLDVPFCSEISRCSLNVGISRLNSDCGVIETGYFTIQEKEGRNYFNTGGFKTVKTCLLRQQSH